MVSEHFSQIARFPLFADFLLFVYPRYFDFPWGQIRGKKHPGVPQGFVKYVFDLQAAPPEYPATRGVDPREKA
jgi:hypothetical protein